MSDCKIEEVEMESIFTNYSKINKQNKTKVNSNANFKTCSYVLKKRDIDSDKYALMRLLCHVSKNVYNCALYELRQAYFKAIGKIDEDGNPIKNNSNESISNTNEFIPADKLETNTIKLTKKEIIEKLPLNNTKLWNLIKDNKDVLMLNSYMILCICREVIKNFNSFLNNNTKMPKYLDKKAYFNLATNQIQYNNKLQVRLPLSNYFSNQMIKDYINNKLFEDDIINEFLDKYKDKGMSCDRFFSIPNYIKVKTKEFSLRLLEKKNLLTYEEITDKIELKKKKLENIKGLTIVEFRIIPINNGEKFKVEFVYKDDELDSKYKDTTKRVLSIDIGIDNLATCVDSGNNYSFIVDGRIAKHKSYCFNKLLCHYQDRLANDKRTSSDYYFFKDVKQEEGKVIKEKIFKYNTKRIKKLYEKKKNYMKTYMYKSAAYILKYAIEKGIDTIVMGYNKDFKLGGFEIEHGKTKHRLNQNLLNIPHAKLRDRLAEICYRNGIKFVTINEAHTSKCSFYDNEEIMHHEKYEGYRRKRGLYITKGGKQVNADVNGSLNIMKRYALELEKQNDSDLIKEVERIRSNRIIKPIRIRID